MIDASSVASTSDKVRFYDEGTVSDISYGKESTFDRRPWVREKTGPALEPGRDWGAGFSPAMRLESDGDELGLVAALGATRKSYAFGRYPYANRTMVVGEYSLGVGKFRVLGAADQRWEETPLHVTMKAYWLSSR